MEHRKALLSELCDLINVNYCGKDVEINALHLCNRVSRYDSILSYITSITYLSFAIRNDKVIALFVTQEVYDSIKEEKCISDRNISFILVDQPEHSFYDLHNALYLKTSFYEHFDFDPIIGKDCTIHESAVIEKGVIIKDSVIIGPNSVVRTGSILESGVIIGCCSVVGSEGFQAIRGYSKFIKHVGGTHIGKGVFIGDNTTIGNELFEGYSEIGDYTKIDNHVHVAHCCRIGKNCVLTSASLMMGSSVLEDNVWLAPNSVILNRCTVSDGALVGTLSFVNRNIKANKTVFGIPAKNIDY